MYLEQQKDATALRRTIDTAIAMIAEEQPEQLRQFSHWFNRMFRGSLENDDIEKVNQLTEAKTMLAEVVDQIEKRAMQQGMLPRVHSHLESPPGPHLRRQNLNSKRTQAY